MKFKHSKTYLTNELKTKSHYQIAEENRVYVGTIRRWLRRYKLTNPCQSWTKEEVELLKRDYSCNPKVYSLFQNRSISSVYHKASRLGLPKLVSKRKYTVNQDFFKKWGPEMAYILGWFFSDGYISSKYACSSFHINKKDICILKKIKKYLSSSHPINKTKTGIQFRIYNKVLYNSLIQLGCIPNKSKCLDFPMMPEEYLSHFVRGYFDGDGSIRFNRPNTIKISFVGSEYFIKKLQIILNKKLNLKIHPMFFYGGIWGCNYYGNDARKLCIWMYRNCKDLYLKRKKERFNNHIKQRINNV